MPKRTVEYLGAASFLLLVAFRWILFAPQKGDIFWYIDFQYWWVASRLWLEGLSPYSEQYLIYGKDSFDIFKWPFFYPPTIMPFFAPLGLFSVETAFTIFYVANLVMWLAVLLLFYLSLRLRLPEQNGLLVAAVTILLTGLFFFPAYRGLYIGQIHLLFTLGAMLWVYGWQKDMAFLQGLGLTLLLIKPQIGLIFLVYGLVSKECYRAVLVAAGLSLLLLAFGAPGFDMLGEVRAFLSNVFSFHGEIDANNPAHFAGLGALLALFGVELPTALTLSCLIVFPVVLRLSSGPTDRIMTSALLGVVAICVSPNHPYDYAYMIPAIGLLLFPLPVWQRLLMGGALLVLAEPLGVFVSSLRLPKSDFPTAFALLDTAAFAFIFLLLVFAVTRKPMQT